MNQDQHGIEENLNCDELVVRMCFKLLADYNQDDKRIKEDAKSIVEQDPTQIR